MGSIIDWFGSLNDVGFVGVVSIVFVALVAYWMIRHLIFGIGRALRSLSLIRDELESAQPYEKENYRFADALDVGGPVGKLWKALYTCYMCKVAKGAEDFFDCRQVKAVSGFTSALIIPVVIAVLGGVSIAFAKFRYADSYAYLLLLAITAAAALILVILWAVMNSAAARSCTRFIAVAHCTLPVEDSSAQLESIAQALGGLPENLPAAGKQGSRDIEARVVESMIEAVMRRVDETLGEKFQRLDSALISSAAAQSELADKVKSIIKDGGNQ